MRVVALLCVFFDVGHENLLKHMSSSVDKHHNTVMVLFGYSGNSNLIVSETVLFSRCAQGNDYCLRCHKLAISLPGFE